MNAHEDFARADELRLPPNRNFGLVLAGVFLVIGLARLMRHEPVRWWALALALVFALLAVARSPWLTPLNRTWMRFGRLLHRAVSPVILGLVFFVAVTPVALIMRVLGKDPLRRRWDADAESYWIPRDPPGPEPESMRRLF